MGGFASGVFGTVDDVGGVFLDVAVEVLSLLKSPEPRFSPMEYPPRPDMTPTRIATSAIAIQNEMPCWFVVVPVVFATVLVNGVKSSPSLGITSRPVTLVLIDMMLCGV